MLVHLPLDTIGNNGQGVGTPATGNGHGAHCEDSLGKCPLAVAGRLGTAMHFDGVDDRLAIDDADELHLPDGLTVTAWLELDVAPNGIGCPYQKLVGVQDQDSWELCLRTNLTGFYFSSESPSAGNGNQLDVPAFALGAWFHSAITWDRIAWCKQVYYGGSLVAESALQALTPLFDNHPSSSGSTSTTERRTESSMAPSMTSASTTAC